MQTIDIAQAIKDNSANVSQNLDPSVLGELLPTVTMTNKGIVKQNTLESNTITSAEKGKAYKLTKASADIAHTIGCLIVGYCTRNFIIAISCSNKFNSISIRNIIGNPLAIQFYTDKENIYYTIDTTGIASMTLITNNAGGYYEPLFTVSEINVENLTPIPIE